MKGKKKNKNLPMYLFGGNTDDLLSQYLQIQQKRSENPAQIENPNTTLADNNIRRVRAEQKAAKNPWTTGLDIFGNLTMQVGGSMMNKGMSQGQGVSDKGFNWGSLMSQGIGALGIVGQSMATGGTADGVDINAEGKEVIETPDGTVAELKGPSHEGGGIDLNVPLGTEVFSKRLKGADGKTMAQRKKAREKSTKKLEKLMQDNFGDKTLKKTYERTKANNEKQEAEDMSRMEMAKQMMQMGQMAMMGGKMNYATGGSTFPPIDFSFLSQMFGQQIPEMTGTADDYHATNDGVTEYGGKPSLATNDYNGEVAKSQFDFDIPATGPYSDAKTGEVVNPGEQQGGGFKDMLSGLFGGSEGGGITLGDGIGMLGNITSTFGPMKNTRENRAGDTPNVNMFKEYGKEGLQKIEESKQYVAGQRDKSLQDLEQGRTGATKRNRNSARGINTLRALDLNTQLGANDSKANIYNAFAQQMQQILGQQANLENQQDQVVMQGEQNKDLADRQDRDNYYTQMAQDISTKGTGLQKIGKDVNAIKTRKTTGKLLNELYPNFDANIMNGSISGKATEPLIKKSSIYSQLGSKELKNKYYDGLTKNGWKWIDGKLYDKAGKELDPSTLKNKSTTTSKNNNETFDFDSIFDLLNGQFKKI